MERQSKENENLFLAPEVLNDEPCGVQADVWSIGALIATL
jgi:hypothetical protein